jgi:sulfide:quinone oxidoreductase
MTRIVILGAGIGGSTAAFEIKHALGDKAEVTVVNRGDRFHFVPSNPWVAVRWREREAIEVELGPVMAKRRIGFRPEGARRVFPAENRVELTTGESLPYDYLVIATGPPPSTPSSRTPVRSWWAPCRARPASARPTSSP